MEYFVDAVKSTITGTLTIPEPIPPLTSSKHGHHTAIPLPTLSPVPGSHGHNFHIEHITKTGHSALVVVTVLFALSAMIVFLMSRRVERKLRLFHDVTFVIIATAFVSYLAMSFGLGAAIVPSYRDGSGGNGEIREYRQVFYARYIDWAITTPLLLLDLALLAGLPLVTTLTLMVADEMMIITGLIAGLSRSTETARWFFFAISDVFFLYVLYVLVVSGRSASKLQSSNVQSVFNVTMAMTVVLWTAYPIVFALTEGKGKISADAEVIVYGILDVFAKIVFGMYLLIAHSHTEGDSVVISEFWTEPRGGRGGYGAIVQDD